MILFRSQAASIWVLCSKSIAYGEVVYADRSRSSVPKNTRHVACCHQDLGTLKENDRRLLLNSTEEEKAAIQFALGSSSSSPPPAMSALEIRRPPPLLNDVKAAIDQLASSLPMSDKLPACFVHHGSAASMPHLGQEEHQRLVAASLNVWHTIVVRLAYVPWQVSEDDQWEDRAARLSADPLLKFVNPQRILGDLRLIEPRISSMGDLSFEEHLAVLKDLLMVAHAYDVDVLANVCQEVRRDPDTLVPANMPIEEEDVDKALAGLAKRMKQLFSSPFDTAPVAAMASVAAMAPVTAAAPVAATTAATDAAATHTGPLSSPPKRSMGMLRRRSSDAASDLGRKLFHFFHSVTKLNRNIAVAKSGTVITSFVTTTAAEEEQKGGIDPATGIWEPYNEYIKVNYTPIEKLYCNPKKHDDVCDPARGGCGQRGHWAQDHVCVKHNGPGTPEKVVVPHYWGIYAWALQEARSRERRIRTLTRELAECRKSLLACEQQQQQQQQQPLQQRQQQHDHTWARLLTTSTILLHSSLSLARRATLDPIVDRRKVVAAATFSTAIEVVAHSTPTPSVQPFCWTNNEFAKAWVEGTTFWEMLRKEGEMAVGKPYWSARGITTAVDLKTKEELALRWTTDRQTYLERATALGGISMSTSISIKEVPSRLRELLQEAALALVGRDMVDDAVAMEMAALAKATDGPWLQDYLNFGRSIARHAVGQIDAFVDRRAIELLAFTDKWAAGTKDWLAVATKLEPFPVDGRLATILQAPFPRHHPRSSTDMGPLRPKPMLSHVQEEDTDINLAQLPFDAGETVPVPGTSFCRTNVVGADGNCLFRAAALLVFGDQTRHAELRASVVTLGRSYLQSTLPRDTKTTADFERQARLMEQGTDGQLYESLQAWLDNMDKPSTWGDELALLLISQLLQRPIAVATVTQGGTTVSILAPCHQPDDNHLGFCHLGGGHYELLLTPESTSSI
ncbi:hypothetical protein FA10DRAFT_294232 [Acaromyces ingoldii]|uniref:OTU domain-containing protein n=1 Tax=Acaromyces ingoldii TaxID=215250 RepID=A0A316YMY7_9BASI|nr:hypothetical protein FA10DRAFT_294232 [Acaromyces ingoldii]PWN90619.1 hypothetical protein FA10DRAFT_294232 [Acaromyces ingoldii]